MKTLIVTVIILLGIGESYGQYTGPGTRVARFNLSEVIRQAKKLDVKDSIVEVEGFITQQIDHETYWLEDKTGKVKVEIEQKYLPAEPFNNQVRVIVVGEVDYNMLEGVEVEAKRPVQIVQDEKKVKGN